MWAAGPRRSGAGRAAPFTLSRSTSTKAAVRTKKRCKLAGEAGQPAPRPLPTPRGRDWPWGPRGARRRSYLAGADLFLQLAVAVVPHEVVQRVLALRPLPDGGVSGDHRPLLMPGPRRPAREEARRRSRGPGPRGGGPALPARGVAAQACASGAGGRGRRARRGAGSRRPREAAAATAGGVERPPPARGGSGHPATLLLLAPRLSHPRTQRRGSTEGAGSRSGRGGARGAGPGDAAAAAGTRARSPRLPAAA